MFGCVEDCLRIVVRVFKGVSGYFSSLNVFQQCVSECSRCCKVCHSIARCCRVFHGVSGLFSVFQCVPRCFRVFQGRVLQGVSGCVGCVRVGVWGVQRCV